ncbi:MAG: hypothetical protein QNL73_06100 [Flavobacteriaceae bacterium]
MSKDYYTKAEVQKLLDELKKEIIEILSPKKSSAKKAFKFNGLTGRIILDKRLWILHEYLTKNGLIEKVTKKEFATAFKGEIDSDIDKVLVKWIGQKNLCPFLLDQLDEEFYIDRESIDKKAKDVFGINNAAELRIKYSYNKNGEPRNSIKIKEIMNALEIEKNNINIEEALYKSIILNDLKVESVDGDIIPYRAANYPGEIITDPLDTYEDTAVEKNNNKNS